MPDVNDMIREGCMLNESCRHYERYANTPSAIAKRLYYYPQWAGCFSCNKDFYIRRQSFQSILLIQTIGGSGKLHYRDQEYILDEHNLALINCTELHTYYPVSDNEWSFRFIHFTGSQSMELYDHIYDVNEGCVFPVTKKLENYVVECVRYCKEKGVSYEVQTSKLISNMLHEILLNIQREERDKIALICDYIAENYNQPLTTKELAEVSCFSRCYFATMFKKYTGTTLHEYLLCYRLDKAKVMLMEDEYTIGEIAEKTGFNDTGTFIRAFKKKEMITPLQYKKQQLMKNVN